MVALLQNIVFVLVEKTIKEKRIITLTILKKLQVFFLYLNLKKVKSLSIQSVKKNDKEPEKKLLKKKKEKILLLSM